MPGDWNFNIHHFMEIKLSNSGDITPNPNGVELLIAPGATRGLAIKTTHATPEGLNEITQGRSPVFCTTDIWQYPKDL